MVLERSRMTVKKTVVFARCFGCSEPAKWFQYDVINTHTGWYLGFIVAPNKLTALRLATKKHGNGLYLRRRLDEEAKAKL